MKQDINTEINENGFVIIQNVFHQDEINTFISEIGKIFKNETDNFGKEKNMFAMRRFFMNLPEIKPLICNNGLKDIINGLSPQKDYFITKSIYFDKPAMSNWFVAYHQDIMIALKEKSEHTGFGPWVKKDNEFNVLPPYHILKIILLSVFIWMKPIQAMAHCV